MSTMTTPTGIAILEAARSADLTFATTADIDMDSLAAVTSTDLEYVDSDIIQAVDDPDYNVLTLPDNEGEWLVSSGDSEWSTLTLNLGDLEIAATLNCEPNQFVTVKDHKMVCAEPHYTTEIQSTTIIQEVPMWTISNLIVVAIVAAIVFKMMPKLTLRNFFRACWKLVIHPFHRKEKDLKKEWDDAKWNTK